MTDDELAGLVKQALFDVAPELEGEEFAPGISFADQFEIDSMDFLKFLIGLHRATGLQIPERDYAQLTTLSDCVAYVKGHVDQDLHIDQGEPTRG